VLLNQSRGRHTFFLTWLHLGGLEEISERCLVVVLVLQRVSHVVPQFGVVLVHLTRDQTEADIFKRTTYRTPGRECDEPLQAGFKNWWSS